jgi:hypothetical protein
MNQTQLPSLINEIPLETKALDNQGRSYDVAIRRSLLDPSLDEPILDIKGTPAKYYMSQLKFAECSPGCILIDAGQQWTIDNFDQIIEEVEKVLEEISKIKKSNILL